MSTNKKKKDNGKNQYSYIRVFPTSFKTSLAPLRCSDNYTKVLSELQRQRLRNPKISIQQENELRKGYLGPCNLTRLRYFDRGQSFLSDTLHTVYGGAMVYKVIATIFYYCINFILFLVETIISSFF